MVDQTFFSAASGGAIPMAPFPKGKQAPMPKYDDGGTVVDDGQDDATGQSPIQPAVPDQTPQGFGGGSPDETPMEPRRRHWGESLKQDLQNVGEVATAPGKAVADSLYGAGQSLGSTIGNVTPRIMSYLSGDSAMPKQDWDALGSQIDPRGTMDQSDRTLHTIDAAMQQDPDAGAAALQHARKAYDLYKANATKELHSGNDDMAAQEATAAQNYVPDGQKTIITPSGDGFAVHTMGQDGPSGSVQLSKDQMHAFLNGEHSLFDHQAEHGASDMAQAAASGTGKPLNINKFGVQTVQANPQGAPEYDAEAVAMKNHLNEDVDRVVQQAAIDKANRETRSNVAQYVAQATHRPVAGNRQDELEQTGENKQREVAQVQAGANQRQQVAERGMNSREAVRAARGGRSDNQALGAFNQAFGAYRDFLKSHPDATQEERDQVLRDNGLDPTKLRGGQYFGNMGNGAPHTPAKPAAPQIRYDAQGRAWTRGPDGKVVPYKGG